MINSMDTMPTRRVSMDSHRQDAAGSPSMRQAQTMPHRPLISLHSSSSSFGQSTATQKLCLAKGDKVVTLWAIPPVTVRMRYPRPDTWFRRYQIDSVNQRMQHGRDNGIGDPAIRAGYRCGPMRAKACSTRFSRCGGTTDHVKTLGPRKPDRRRSDCPALMLSCSRRIPEAILN